MDNVIPRPRIIKVLGNNRSHAQFDEQFTWCERTFGPFRGTWNYYIMEDAYAFKDEREAFMFRLKWG